MGWYGSSAPVRACWKQPSGGRSGGKLSRNPLGVSRTSSFNVERSAVPANPVRPVSAAADIRPPNLNGGNQS